jgi:3-hydroxy-9,10-secoandrosta-1,3,5(10)-triene-9,17-dione monooxygenase reductase component
VLWSLSRKAGSLQVFEQTTHWAVHVLAHGQTELSRHFARSGLDKFADVQYHRGDGNTPLLDGCSARFLCRSKHLYDGGDHVILVGEVIEFERNEAPALVYNDSGYAIATSTEVKSTAAALPTPSQVGSNLGFLIGSAFYHMYAELRDAAGSLGFSNTETFVLQALSERAWRSRTEIDALLHYAGHASGQQVIDDLEARNLLVAREAEDSEFDLTEQGRCIADQMNTAALAITGRMDQTLGASGSIALRALLGRFVRDTEAQRPVKWL